MKVVGGVPPRRIVMFNWVTADGYFAEGIPSFDTVLSPTTPPQHLTPTVLDSDPGSRSLLIPPTFYERVTRRRGCDFTRGRRPRAGWGSAWTWAGPSTSCIRWPGSYN